MSPALAMSLVIPAYNEQARLPYTLAQIEAFVCREHIECEVIVDKQLAQHAALHLGRPPSAIARTLTIFAKTLDGPWRADEKAAATAAWLALNPTRNLVIG